MPTNRYDLPTKSQIRADDMQNEKCYTGIVPKWTWHKQRRFRRETPAMKTALFYANLLRGGIRSERKKENGREVMPHVLDAG